MPGIKKYDRKTVGTVMNLAVPAMIESFFNSFIALVDSFMVSSLGASAVAAVGLTSQPRLITWGFLSALGVAMAALVARRYGEKRREAANGVMVTGVGISLVMSVVFSVITIVFASQIMKLCGANEDTLKDSTDYFVIIMAGLVFKAVQITLNAAQRGCGNTKITMITNVTANVVNVIFNYLLIGGKFGFPALGVRGAAIATLLGMIAAALLSVIFACKDGFINIMYALREKIRPTVEAFKNIFKLGYGVMLEQVLLRIGFMATAIMAADMGTNAFAAYQVSNHILSLSFAFGDGLQQAAISLVGRSLGEKEPLKAKNYVDICQMVGVVISAVLVVVFLSGSRFAMELFFDEKEVVDIGVSNMYVVTVILLFHIRQIVYMGALRGAGDTFYTAMISAICVTVVRTVFTYLFAYTFGFGIIGVWLGTMTDLLVRAILSTLRFRSGKWMSIKV